MKKLNIAQNITKIFCFLTIMSAIFLLKAFAICADKIINNVLKLFVKCTFIYVYIRSKVLESNVESPWLFYCPSLKKEVSF